MAVDKTKYVGEEYESKHGKYKIIEYLGGNHPKVKVKFELTGSEVICRYDTAYKGFALDPEYMNFLYVGKTYETHCGPVLILKYLGFYKKCDFVQIRFILTGYEKEERLKNILNGRSYDPNYFMYTVKDKIFHSISYGDFKIIAEVGKDNNGFKMVRIHFIVTGYEYDVRYDAARQGKVKDPKYFMYTVKDKIFHSNNYGDFKIIQDIGFTEDDIHHQHRLVKIKFTNTGTERIVRYEDVLKGEVKDTYFDNKYEANRIIGNNHINDLERYLRKTWSNMMNRCYSNNATAYSSYGGKGIIVDEEWHNYNNFRRDVVNLPGWQLKFNDPVNYQLDKDLLQHTISHEMRIYSKDTCIWLHNILNQRLKNNNIYGVYNYYNTIYQIDNLYYVKTILNLPNYGPFNSLESAICMVNYCYSSCGLNHLLLPSNTIMTPSQIFNNTSDRKIMVTIAQKDS